MVADKKTQLDKQPESFDFTGRTAHTAIMQSAITVPGVDLNSGTLYRDKYPGLKMTIVKDGWVQLIFKNKEVLIPSANFKNLILD